jgi:2-oxoisovalerate dehydrogenase E2 component (dihydrolipoyl transacylase)
MTRLQTFKLPDVGEGLTEAEVLSWRVAPGDTVTVNQIIVEIETAKAAVELPSPFAGTVHEILVQPGATVDVGTPIVTVDTDPTAGPVDSGPADAGAKIGEVGADGRIATLVGFVDPNAGVTRRARRTRPVEDLDFDSDSVPRVSRASYTPPPTDPVPTTAPAPEAQPAPSAQPAAEVAPEPAAAAQDEPASATVSAPESSAPVSATPSSVPPVAEAAPVEVASTPTRPQAPKAAPPVRKLAKDLGVDLTGITPADAGGVISRAEVEKEAARGAAQAAAAARPALADAVRAAGAPAAAPVTPAADEGFDPATRERRIPIKGVRKATAAAMVSSAFTAPHVTEFLTVDVTPMFELRDRLRSRPEFADVRLGPLTFAMRAVCLALRRTPELNATWDADGGAIVVKEYVHLGIAAATPRGLVVPNVRDADRLDLRGLAAALAELTATARAGRTAPGAMTGGTFTITNIGVLGVDTGTPILNPGEAGILALGSVKDAPWVVDGQLAVRKVCQLALSFDHRVVDGQQGSQFLADVGALLADPGLAIAF